MHGEVTALQFSCVREFVPIRLMYVCSEDMPPLLRKDDNHLSLMFNLCVCLHIVITGSVSMSNLATGSVSVTH